MFACLHVNTKTDNHRETHDSLGGSFLKNENIQMFLNNQKH